MTTKTVKNLILELNDLRIKLIDLLIAHQAIQEKEEDSYRYDRELVHDFPTDSIFLAKVKAILEEIKTKKTVIITLLKDYIKDPQHANDVTNFNKARITYRTNILINSKGSSAVNLQEETFAELIHYLNSPESKKSTLYKNTKYLHFFFDESEIAKFGVSAPVQNTDQETYLKLYKKIEDRSFKLSTKTPEFNLPELPEFNLTEKIYGELSLLQRYAQKGNQLGTDWQTCLQNFLSNKPADYVFLLNCLPESIKTLFDKLQQQEDIYEDIKIFLESHLASFTENLKKYFADNPRKQQNIQSLFRGILFNEDSTEDELKARIDCNSYQGLLYQSNAPFETPLEDLLTKACKEPKLYQRVAGFATGGQGLRDNALEEAINAQQITPEFTAINTLKSAILDIENSLTGINSALEAAAEDPDQFLRAANNSSFSSKRFFTALRISLDCFELDYPHQTNEENLNYVEELENGHLRAYFVDCFHKVDRLTGNGDELIPTAYTPQEASLVVDYRKNAAGKFVPYRFEKLPPQGSTNLTVQKQRFDSLILESFQTALSRAHAVERIREILSDTLDLGSPAVETLLFHNSEGGLFHDATSLDRTSSEDPVHERLVKKIKIALNYPGSSSWRTKFYKSYQDHIDQIKAHILSSPVAYSLQSSTSKSIRALFAQLIRSADKHQKQISTLILQLLSTNKSKDINVVKAFISKKSGKKLLSSAVFAEQLRDYSQDLFIASNGIDLLTTNLSSEGVIELLKALTNTTEENKSLFKEQVRLLLANYNYADNFQDIFTYILSDEGKGNINFLLANKRFLGEVFSYIKEKLNDANIDEATFNKIVALSNYDETIAAFIDQQIHRSLSETQRSGFLFVHLQNLSLHPVNAQLVSPMATNLSRLLQYYHNALLERSDSLPADLHTAKSYLAAMIENIQQRAEQENIPNFWAQLSDEALIKVAATAENYTNIDAELLSIFSQRPVIFLEKLSKTIEGASPDSSLKVTANRLLDPIFDSAYLASIKAKLNPENFAALVSTLLTNPMTVRFFEEKLTNSIEKSTYEATTVSFRALSPALAEFIDRHLARDAIMRAVAAPENNDQFNTLIKVFEKNPAIFLSVLTEATSNKEENSPIRNIARRFFNTIFNYRYLEHNLSRQPQLFRKIIDALLFDDNVIACRDLFSRLLFQLKEDISLPLLRAIKYQVNQKIAPPQTPSAHLYGAKRLETPEVDKNVWTSNVIIRQAKAYKTHDRRKLIEHVQDYLFSTTQRGMRLASFFPVKRDLSAEASLLEQVSVFLNSTSLTKTQDLAHLKTCAILTTDNKQPAQIPMFALQYLHLQITAHKTFLPEVRASGAFPLPSMEHDIVYYLEDKPSDRVVYRDTLIMSLVESDRLSQSKKHALTLVTHYSLSDPGQVTIELEVHDSILTFLYLSKILEGFYQLTSSPEFNFEDFTRSLGGDDAPLKEDYLDIIPVLKDTWLVLAQKLIGANENLAEAYERLRLSQENYALNFLPLDITVFPKELYNHEAKEIVKHAQRLNPQDIEVFKSLPLDSCIPSKISFAAQIDDNLSQPLYQVILEDLQKLPPAEQKQKLARLLENDDQTFLLFLLNECDEKTAVEWLTKAKVIAFEKMAEIITTIDIEEDYQVWAKQQELADKAIIAAATQVLHLTREVPAEKAPASKVPADVFTQGRGVHTHCLAPAHYLNDSEAKNIAAIKYNRAKFSPYASSYIALAQFDPENINAIAELKERLLIANHNKDSIALDFINALSETLRLAAKVSSHPEWRELLSQTNLSFNTSSYFTSDNKYLINKLTASFKGKEELFSIDLPIKKEQIENATDLSYKVNISSDNRLRKIAFLYLTKMLNSALEYKNDSDAQNFLMAPYTIRCGIQGDLGNALETIIRPFQLAWQDLFQQLQTEMRLESLTDIYNQLRTDENLAVADLFTTPAETDSFQALIAASVPLSDHLPPLQEAVLSTRRAMRSVSTDAALAAVPAPDNLQLEEEKEKIGSPLLKT